jgi:diguanylate cyclase (GGDEF)-like protein
MKRLIATLALLLAWTALGGAAPPPGNLTTIREIQALTRAEADEKLPVAVEATVTFFKAGSLFVEDGGQAIFVGDIPAVNSLSLLPGDRILIEGETEPSFCTNISYRKITFLRHGDQSKPVPAEFDGLMKANYDCKRVTVHGVIRSISSGSSRNLDTSWAKLLIDGGYIDLSLYGNADTLKDLLDAEVDVTGVVSGEYGTYHITRGEMRLTGIMIYVLSADDVKVLKRPAFSPWTLPYTPFSDVITGYHVNNLSQRIHVRGVITYYQPGSAVVLQGGSRSLMVRTSHDAPLQIGDEAEATGIPDVYEGFWTLTESEIQDLHVPSNVKPQPATWAEIVSKKYDSDLVAIEGQVIMAIREASQDQYVLISDGNVFSANFRHSDEFRGLTLPPMKQVPLGSRVRVTGVCLPDSSNPFSTSTYSLLMRSPDDIEVIANPTLLNVRNLVILIVLLLLLVAFGGVWGWRLERTVRHQNAATAEILRKRSHILEDINGSRPLPDILEKIVEMVSFTLDGAPCWCELADGSKIGEAPAASHKLRVARANIHARRGLALGALFAAFNAKTPPTDSEELSLDNGTRLAALAIETRRLYLDLRRRSEFDLLTDIHNRFSLDKRLDVLIEGSRPEVCVFGLIYIDLDKFKLINDRYGHHVGDLFLQEVALRMKRQLRGGDMLARLGGDEFAVLVSEVHNRAGVEEAALRLERCFEEPFAVEGLRLQGAASIGIALYPEDGATRDSLLMAADAAMYAVKNRKKEIEKER